MAWVDVPGSNSVWQFENTATAANTYSDAAGTYSGGQPQCIIRGNILKKTRQKENNQKIKNTCSAKTTYQSAT